MTAKLFSADEYITTGDTRSRWTELINGKLIVNTAANTVLVYRRSTRNSPTFDVALELAVGGTLTSPLLEDFALNITELFTR